MSVKSTQLHGMLTQVESWLKLIPTMTGYVDEDYNALAELESALHEADHWLHSAIREDKDESGPIVY